MLMEKVTKVKSVSIFLIVQVNLIFESTVVFDGDFGMKNNCNSNFRF